jgi:hypothetical protein
MRLHADLGDTLFSATPIFTNLGMLS